MNPRIASLLVVSAVATATLAGCGVIQDRVDDAVGNAVEEGVERAIEGGSGGDVDLNFDGDGASLPNNFPGDVPQPNGTIQASIGAGDGFVVSFQTSESGAADFLGEFSSWTEDGQVDLGDAKAYTYSNDRYTVGIMVSPNGDQTSVNYTVTLKSSS